jgi:predicted TIM-barrel fold metal-dependent hydrolase
LAHGKQLEKTLAMLREFPHLRCDTAFMPEKNRRAFVDTGFESRILFGTDFPITHYWEWKSGRADIDKDALKANYKTIYDIFNKP